MRKMLWVVTLTAALVLPLAALAQDDAAGPITWIAYSKVKSGKTGEAVKLTLRDQEFYDGLLADGTINSWGITTPINHRPGDDWNHAVWVTAESWQKIGEWTDAFGARMAGFDEAEQESREAAFEEAYHAGSHHDSVVRHSHIREPGEGAARPAYFYFGSFNAHPGQEQALTDLYMDFVTPIADKLREEGVVVAYGMYTSELHGDAWTHGTWYMLPDLGAVDKLTGAINSSITPEIVARLNEITDTTAHTDTISMILHLGGAPAGPGMQ